MSRIQTNREIFQAFDFLGIPHSAYLALKAEHGGQAGLHAHLATLLGA